MKTGIELIAQKRAKHESKGYSLEHDKEHIDGELAIVAADLATRHTEARLTYNKKFPEWGLNKKSTIDRLSIAGSLIAAEIDRLLALPREAAKKEPERLNLGFEIDTNAEEEKDLKRYDKNEGQDPEYYPN